MESQDRFQQLVSTLPLELKMDIIHWMVRLDGVIMSTREDAGDRLKIILNVTTNATNILRPTKRIQHPVDVFSATTSLRNIATREFGKANWFLVDSNRSTREDSHAIDSQGRLEDDISRRDHVRNLILHVTTSPGRHRSLESAKRTIGWQDIDNMRECVTTYPRLESLQVHIIHIPDYFNDNKSRQRSHVQTAFQLITNMIAALRSVRTVRWKSVALLQLSTDRITLGPVTINACGASAEAAAWEMMDFPLIEVVLS